MRHGRDGIENSLELLPKKSVAQSGAATQQPRIAGRVCDRHAGRTLTSAVPDGARDLHAAREPTVRPTGIVGRVLEPPTSVPADDVKIARIRAALALTGVIVFGLSAPVLAILGLNVPAVFAGAGAVGLVFFFMGHP